MSYRGWLFIVVLVAAFGVAGCNSTTPEAKPTFTPPPPTNTPILVPTEAGATGDIPGLGEIERVARNGFSFRPVQGWELSLEGDSASMEAPDAIVSAGPGFFITGGFAEDFGVTINGPEDVTESVIQSYLANFIPVETSYLETPKRVQVKGAVGNDVVFVVPGEAEPYRGRITVLQKGNQIFLMLGLAPPDRWDTEMRPLYEDVLRATEMFEPER